ncbi:hypothetical protein PPL_03656 [Heterostelium album PN500]|uniref:BED-type domain-containing protein n=1 Tax=Heterostelium pallidum (strain ATCC 26659 / Pp 5 / PN500) TaxID=670386 RepID=D3B6A8_HETP5|nr:hypothetical protein PPL_03656 [Heterostelium album PN500]EFA82878.1 hypothetical protein PPL_03656 [Heterostelium album PN500]|eukprot:XP_020434995.1 hypothetical protein PPL_03656 [Heterostelium album PN500]
MWKKRDNADVDNIWDHFKIKSANRNGITTKVKCRLCEYTTEYCYLSATTIVLYNHLRFYHGKFKATHRLDKEDLPYNKKSSKNTRSQNAPQSTPQPASATQIQVAPTQATPTLTAPIQTDPMLASPIQTTPFQTAPIRAIPQLHVPRAVPHFIPVRQEVIANDNQRPISISIQMTFTTPGDYNVNVNGVGIDRLLRNNY